MQEFQGRWGESDDGRMGGSMGAMPDIEFAGGREELVQAALRRGGFMKNIGF